MSTFIGARRLSEFVSEIKMQPDNYAANPIPLTHRLRTCTNSSLEYLLGTQPQNIRWEDRELNISEYYTQGCTAHQADHGMLTHRVMVLIRAS